MNRARKWGPAWPFPPTTPNLLPFPAEASLLREQSFRKVLRHTKLHYIAENETKLGLFSYSLAWQIIFCEVKYSYITLTTIFSLKNIWHKISILIPVDKPFLPSWKFIVNFLKKYFHYLKTMKVRKYNIRSY